MGTPTTEVRPGRSVTIRYRVPLELHLDESAELGARYLTTGRRALLKQAWFPALLMALSILGGLWIYRALRGRPPSHPDLVPVAIAFGAGVWSLVQSSSPGQGIKRALPLLRENSKGAAGCYLGECCLTLTEDTIEYEDQHGSAIYPWESAYELRESARGFTLLLSNHRFILVPLTADPDREGAGFARERFEAHRCPDPAAANVLAGEPAVCPRCKHDISDNRSAVCAGCGSRLSLAEISKARCLGEEARRGG